MKLAPQALGKSTLELDEMARGLVAYPDFVSHPLLRASSASSSVAQGGVGRRLLLTGGAGFLGVHILAQLTREQLFDHIFLVVRKPEKLMLQLARYGFGTDGLSRVTVVAGDLQTMAPAELPDVDVVLHSAARIHCLDPLRRLWGDNVLATQQVLRRYTSRAAVCLVSTLSVFVSSNQSGDHLPVDVPVSDDYVLYGGYAQSKFICERMAMACGAHIVRPGLLTGASTKGTFPQGDFCSTVLQDLKQMRCFPSDFVDAEVDMTPVDIAAQRIVVVLPTVTTAARYTHVFNPQPVRLTEILEAIGATAVTPEEFETRIAGLPRMRRVLLKYAFYKPQALQDLPEFFNVDLFQTTGHRYGATAALKTTNADLLSLYLSVAGPPG